MHYGALRKHRDNTDIAMEILSSFLVREKRCFIFRVRWWRISRLRPPEPMNLEQSLEIPVAKWSAWEPYFYYPLAEGEPRHCELAFAVPRQS